MRESVKTSKTKVLGLAGKLILGIGMIPFASGLSGCQTAKQNQSGGILLEVLGAAGAASGSPWGLPYAILGRGMAAQGRNQEMAEAIRDGKTEVVVNGGVDPIMECNGAYELLNIRFNEYETTKKAVSNDGNVTLREREYLQEKRKSYKEALEGYQEKSARAGFSGSEGFMKNKETLERISDEYEKEEVALMNEEK